MTLAFEWDEEKAERNLLKHGIRFEEACTVFLDPFLLTILDPDHSIGKECYIDLGMSTERRVPVVVYTERDSRIRIISCRQATRNERRQY